MISRHSLRLLILTVLLSSATFAQTPAATPLPSAEEQRKAQQELQAKALNLLEDVIKDADSFKHPENRIRLKAAAANILWTHDEPRARLIFKEAVTNLIALLNNQDSADAASNTRMLAGVHSLRGELLQMLAQRDARLARDFLRATRSQAAQSASQRETRIDQPLEMNLAMQIAATDPKQALEIAEENLSAGLSYELPQLLTAIRQKDPEGAAKLAGMIVAKLRTEKLESNAARQVAISLLREATQNSNDEGKGAKATTPLLDQQTVRELIELMAAEALRPSSTSPELLAALQEMLPTVEKYSPARAAQVRRKTPATPVAAERTANDGDPEIIEIADMNENRYTAVFENGSVSDLLTEAAKAPEGMREMLYNRAAAKLMEEGDVDRARQIINEHVKDPEQRKMLLSQLDDLATFKAAEQGKIEQTRKMLATLRTNEERVMALTQLATRAAANGEKKNALLLLEEARGMLVSRAKNFPQLGAQVAVARAYAPLDAARSLSILEPVVDQLNELLAAAVVLGSFITEELIKDDEIMMEPLTMISNEVFVHYLGDVSTLARADFERTKALADRFLREEIRVAARLLLAQSILSPKPASEMPVVPITRHTVTSGQEH